MRHCVGRAAETEIAFVIKHCVSYVRDLQTSIINEPNNIMHMVDVKLYTIMGFHHLGRRY